MSYGYATSNLAKALAAAAFTDGSGLITNGAFLNDGRMDKQATGLSSPYASAFNLVLDFGSATSLAGFALLNHNCCVDSGNNSVFVAVDAADDSGFSVNLVHPKTATQLYSGNDVNDVRRKDHVLQFPAVSKRWWKLKFTYTANLSPAIGEVFAYGGSVTLPRGSIYGSGETEEISSAEVDFKNGNHSAYLLGGPLKTKNYQFADLSLSDQNAFLALWRATKAHTLPFLWLEDVESISSGASSAGQEVVYGRFETPAFQWRQDDYAIYQPPGFNIRSLGREVGS